MWLDRLRLFQSKAIAGPSTSDVVRNWERRRHSALFGALQRREEVAGYPLVLTNLESLNEPYEVWVHEGDLVRRVNS